MNTTTRSLLQVPSGRQTASRNWSSSVSRASGWFSYFWPQAIRDAMSSLVAAVSGSERLLCRSVVNSGCSASPSSSSDWPLPSTSW